MAAGDFRPCRSGARALALLGAIFFRRLMTNTPLAPEQAGELVETVLGRSIKA